MNVLTLAIIIDTVWGDPVYSWHPIRLIGLLINKLEGRLYNKNSTHAKKILRGGVLVLLCISIVGLIYGIIFFLTRQYLGPVHWIVEGILLSQLMATRSLFDEGKRIHQVLVSGDIALAKEQISYLVSRDTDTLSAADIYKAAIETLTENTTDAIVAPMFYYGIFGIVGISVYKAINTMDSMIGYKNERYLYFGKIAARLDDIVNFFPARIAAFFIMVLALIFKHNFTSSVKCFVEQRKWHSSPNAGCTEAAMAGAIDICLSGPTYYFGKRLERPFIGYTFEQHCEKHLCLVMRYIIGVGIMSYIMSYMCMWW